MKYIWKEIIIGIFLVLLYGNCHNEKIQIENITGFFDKCLFSFSDQNDRLLNTVKLCEVSELSGGSLSEEREAFKKLIKEVDSLQSELYKVIMPNPDFENLQKYFSNALREYKQALIILSGITPSTKTNCINQAKEHIDQSSAYMLSYVKLVNNIKMKQK